MFLKFCKTVALLLIGTASTRAALAQAAPQKPNIIVMFTDDQGWADLSIQGAVSDIKTPNIDALARGGVRFTAGYVTSPQCSPSRAGLVTGRYQQRFGLDSITELPLPLEEQTLAERLKPAGYVSGMVGKWHLEPNHTNKVWIRKNFPDAPQDKPFAIPEAAMRPYLPLGQGFDECFWGEMQRYLATYHLDGRPLSPQGEWITTPNYRLDVQTDAALSFIEKHRAKPFFLYLGHYGPHVPLEAPKRYLDRFPGPMPERRRYALAMMAAIDDGVGRIMAKLREHGLEENTLIVFASDNGAPLVRTKPDTKPITENGWDGSLNDPFNGEKGMLAEGGIRVPFVMQWKKRLPAGKVYDHPISALDVAATAVAAAGLPKSPDLDGVNLVPFLRGTMLGAPHDALFWRFWNQSAVRARRWKLIKVGGEREFLFDLETDPEEKKNLIKTRPDIARVLAARLSKWSSQMQPPPATSTSESNQEKGWYDHFFGRDEHVGHAHH